MTINPAFLFISGHGLSVRWARYGEEFGKPSDCPWLHLPGHISVHFGSRDRQEDQEERRYLFTFLEDNPRMVQSHRDRVVCETFTHQSKEPCPNLYLISTNPIDIDIHVVQPDDRWDLYHQYIVPPGYYTTLEDILKQPYKCSTIQGKNWDLSHNPPIERGTVVDTDTAIPDLILRPPCNLNVVWCASRSQDVKQEWKNLLRLEIPPVG